MTRFTPDNLHVRVVRNEHLKTKKDAHIAYIAHVH